MNSIATKPPAIPKLRAVDHTVVFFDDTARPSALPPFPYLVVGSSAGRVKLMAYVAAFNADDVSIAVSNCFPGSHIESIELGRREPEPPTMHGVAHPVARTGFWRRLVQVFN
jgi:hypothetical protein